MASSSALSIPELLRSTPHWQTQRQPIYRVCAAAAGVKAVCLASGCADASRKDPTRCCSSPPKTGTVFVMPDRNSRQKTAITSSSAYDTFLLAPLPAALSTARKFSLLSMSMDTVRTRQRRPQVIKLMRQYSAPCWAGSRAWRRERESRSTKPAGCARVKPVRAATPPISLTRSTWPSPMAWISSIIPLATRDVI